MKRSLWLVVVVLAVFVLVAGLLTASKPIFGNRFAQEMAAIRAKGEPTSLREYFGKPVPASQNAANPYLQLILVIDSRQYERDIDTLVYFPSSPGSHINAADWQAAETAFIHTKTMRELVEDAVSRPECYFGICMDDPFMTIHPQLMAIRTMIRLYGAGAVVSARNGRMDEAVDDICMQIRMVQSLKTGPFLVHHLWRIAMLRIITQDLLAMMEYGSPSENLARKLYDELGRVSMDDSYRVAWLSERAALLSLSNPGNMGRYISAASYTATGNPDAVKRMSHSASSLYARTVMRGDLVSYLRYAAAQIEGADLSYAEAADRGLMDGPQGLPLYAFLSKSMVPDLVRGGLVRYGTKTDLSEVRVLLALHAYKGRFGMYPATIRELESRLGWDLPKDPFTGRDLIYRRQAKGFILYSLGPDMKDDAGRAIGHPVKSTDDRGDIALVWAK